MLEECIYQLADANYYARVGKNKKWLLLGFQPEFMRHIITSYLLFCPLALLLSLNTLANTTGELQQNTLVDSVLLVIENSSGDSLTMEEAYTLIRKNRRELGQDYIRVLRAYGLRASEKGYMKGIMQANDRIGLQYRYDEMYDSAIFYHKLSLEMALECNDSVQLYYTFNNLGQAYRKQDINVLAIGYFHKALAITEALGDSKPSSYTLNSLGATYVVQKDYDLAMHYFQQSVKIAEANSDIKTMAYNYGAMGEVFLELGNPDSAMYYFKTAKEFKLQIKRKKGIAVSDHLIAQAYFEMEKYIEAEKYFNLSIPIHRSEHNDRYLAMCYAYMGMIKTQQNITDSARYYLNEAERLALLKHSFETLSIIYPAMFELNRKMGNWEKAVEALQLAKAYSDSIISIANAQQFQALEVQYNTQLKEQRIKRLSAENKIGAQRLRLLLVLAVLLILAIALGIYMQWMRRKQTRYERDELKQQLMRSQMNPHFLFNALGSIQGYMYKNETKKAAGFLGNFASLTRSILENSTEEYIALEEEINMLKNYLELEKMRMSNRFDYTIIFDEEMETEFMNVPPMLLQPFVENSIKHGLRDIRSDGKIEITLLEHDRFIEAHIIDNGIGIKKAAQSKAGQHKSKATSIFKQRMDILKKSFDKLPEPEIVDLETEGKQGTKVIVFLPIKPD